MNITFTLSSLFLLLNLTDGLQQYVTPSRQRASIGSIPMLSPKDEMEVITSFASDIETKFSELPPVLQGIVDERQEFRLNMGRAMDILKHDYPEILRNSLDFSIYSDEIKFANPSGLQLTGLQSYKTAFSVVQKLAGFLYAPKKSRVQVRMMFDLTLSTIRISWNIELHPKLMGLRPLYVDGISIYTMDSPSGKIIEHEIDNLMINGRPAESPYSIFSILIPEQERSYPRGLPVGALGLAGSLSKNLISSARRKIKERNNQGPTLTI